LYLVWCKMAQCFSVKKTRVEESDEVRTGDERERLITASPVMTKSREPLLGAQ